MSLDGIHIEHFNADAPGTRVILVHGAPDRSRNFRRVIDELNLSSPLTIYDRRGYGRSAAAVSGGGGFATHADDLVSIIGDQPAIVVAQSAGGSISLLASTLRPDLVVSVGVWEPPMVAYEWWGDGGDMGRLMRWVNYTDPRQCVEDQNRWMLGDDKWESLSDETREMLWSEGEAFWLDMCSQVEMCFDIDDVVVPAFVGYGTAHWSDHFVAANQRLAERLGAHSQKYEGAAHAAHITHPEAWAAFARRTIDLAVATGGAEVNFGSRPMKGRGSGSSTRA